MAIDSGQVNHIARLARLSISEDEKEMFGLQLSNILHYIEKLNELDTSEVAPTSHVLDLSNVFRQDAPRPSLSSREALSNSPDRDGDYYRVPRIID